MSARHPVRRARPRSGVRLVPLLVAAAVVVLVGLLSAGPAGAHADVDSSDPADQSVVEGPVDVVVVRFTAGVVAVPEQFGIVAGDGSEVPVGGVEATADPSVLEVRPAEPLADGAFAVTWAIRAADDHAKTGTVAFAVTPPAADAATATDVGPEGVDGSGAGTESDAAPEVDATEAAEESLAALDVPSSSPTAGADRVAAVARWLVYAALLLCVGGLGYLAWVHRGSVAEGRWLVHLVRRAAVVLVAAAVVEFAAQVVAFAGGAVDALADPSAWADVATANFGTGSALRLVGAGLVLGFLRVEPDGSFGADAGEGVGGLTDADLDLLGPPSAAVAVHTDPTAPSAARLRVEASPVAFVGAALLVASEAFIGHTASTEPRLLVVAADAVHLVAAGLWAAGCVLLAATLGRRSRHGQPLDARLLAVRFSVVAGWALLAVALSGVALAWGILDSPSALWGTTFGVVLVAKVLVVAVVAGIGGYNHRVVVPALERGDDDAGAVFRRTVTSEAALLGVVLVLTTVLVASSAV